jgi:N-acetylmuramoyl-L-alanine amidase
VSDVVPALISRPDSALVADLHPSSNIEPRKKGLKPSMLILHYTGLPSVERAIEVLSRPDYKVSCHYVVDEGGRITQMVAEEARAWHAGVSCWAGETDINSASIGIEIQNPGHMLGYPDFPAGQMRAVAQLSRDIARRHGMDPRRVLAHSDIAPGRKIDPGEKFSWEALHGHGVGHWVPPAPLDGADPGTAIGAKTPEVTRARLMLADYGYRIDPDGAFNEEMQTVVRAFQLHFRQSRCDGALDRSTLDTLSRLFDSQAPKDGATS